MIKQTNVRIRDGKALSIIVSRTIKNIKINKVETNTIIFKDSFKILPMSIKTIIKGFELKLQTPKLYFPYRIMKIYNLNYEGALPDKSFYDNISDLEFKNLKRSLKIKIDSWRMNY
jgi:DNA polymerase type B, organellar and viral